MNSKLTKEEEDSIKKFILDLKEEDVRIRRTAVQRLGRFREKASSAVPALIETLKDEDVYVRKEAVYALGCIGSQAASAIDALIMTMKDEDDDIRSRAVLALGLIGSQAVSAVPFLIKALKDSYGEVRHFAALSLKRIGPQASSAIPSLIEALNDTNNNVRVEASSALGVFGEQSSSAIPILINFIKRKDRNIRYSATETLGKIGKPAIPVLMEILHDEDEVVRSSAITALGMIGEKATSAIPEITKKLQDSSIIVRRSAAEALGKIGTTSTHDIPALIKSLKEKDNRIQKAATESLIKIGKQAIPDLVEMVSDSDYIIRRKIIEIIGEIGESAVSAIPRLIEVLKDENERVCKPYAARALGKIGQKTARTVPILIETLNDKSEYLRIATMEALLLLGPKADSAVPEMIKALKNWKIRIAVTDFLNKADIEVNPQIEEVLKEVNVKSIFGLVDINYYDINNLIKKLKAIPGDVSNRYEISKEVLIIFSQKGFRSKLYNELVESGDYVAELVNMIDTEGIHDALWELESGLFYSLKKFGLTIELLPYFLQLYEENSHFEDWEGFWEILEPLERAELVNALMDFIKNESKSSIKHKAINILVTKCGGFPEAIKMVLKYIVSDKYSWDKKHVLRSITSSCKENQSAINILEEAMITHSDKELIKDIQTLFNKIGHQYKKKDIDWSIEYESSLHLLKKDKTQAIEKLKHLIYNAEDLTIRKNSLEQLVKIKTKTVNKIVLDYLTNYLNHNLKIHTLNLLKDNKREDLLPELKELYETNLSPNFKLVLFETIKELKGFSNKELLKFYSDLLFNPDLDKETRINSASELAILDIDKAINKFQQFIVVNDYDSYSYAEVNTWVGEKLISLSDKFPTQRKINVLDSVLQNHKNPRVRNKALKKIGLIENDTTASIVSSALFDDDVEIIGTAASIINKYKWDDFKDVLREAINEVSNRLDNLRYSPTIGEGRHRYESEVPECEGVLHRLQTVYDSLKSSDSKENINELLEAIEKTDNENQTGKYYNEIEAINPNDSIPLLLKLYEIRQNLSRNIIIYSLQGIFLKYNPDEILEYNKYVKHLIKFYKEEESSYQRKQLLYLISQFDDDEAIKEIIDALNSKDMDLVLAAKHLVERKKIQDSRILDNLLNALKRSTRYDKGSLVNSKTMQLTKTLRSIIEDPKLVTPTFLEMLAKDKPYNSRKEAILAISQFPCDESEKVILDHIKNDKEIGIAALQSFNGCTELREKKDKWEQYEDIILEFARRNKSVMAKKEISDALGCIGSRKSLPLLFEIFDTYQIHFPYIKKASGSAIYSIIKRSDLLTLLSLLEEILEETSLRQITMTLKQNAKEIDKKQRKSIISKLQTKINKIKQERDISNKPAILRNLESTIDTIKKQK